MRTERVFTVEERRARLARRHFLAAPGGTAETVTAALVGLHATDPATPYLSLWARVPEFAVTDLDEALYQRRSLVKHLAMRRTLWVVAADDLHAVQAASSDRVAANERRKLIADIEKGGIATDGAAWLDTACAAVLEYLDSHGATTAAELRAALPELAGSYDPAPGKRWGGATPVSPRVLTVLAVRGDIVRGPNTGGWTVSRPRWASRRSWLGAGATADADAAGAALVGTWLRAFGPATVADIAWWFGHTRTWTGKALAAVGAVEVDLHGSPGVALPDDLESEPPVEPWCALLPGLDVTVMGWFDREWYLDGHRGQVFDRNGNAGPTAWADGRVVGGWVHDTDGRVQLRLTADVTTDTLKGLQHKADELTDWLDGVQVKPRFPSPLSKGS
ncbi:winged helix DNA-binding domain-containing protein [Mycolicibacterium sp. 120266]|uniref:winged helix DNA-binding domain-containing protein n=1 Tax=Mycolicibacterium sp. 120266 TaxID=3090601 RepID=UPI00299EFFFD|nr:winged helix DNA-binding domain-containing protein [Mycolicibacterium sp. 120266]MDX1875812.1 winged helix DNA-binding domain-containing protein [Mycolicibacterium sp. 120266]